MDLIIEWFKSSDWVANAIAILVPLGGAALWMWRRARKRLARPRSFSALVKAKLGLPFPMEQLQSLAQVAIVDDNLSDFPVADLRKAGFQIKTYKHVGVADFDDLSQFDVVFLDMHDIVRDDPTEGGLKLIRVLRKKNPRQKICAVSGNQFNPSATAFFKLADDALNKPMSAQRCVEVLEAFLREKLDPVALARLLDEPERLAPNDRAGALEALASSTSQHRAAVKADFAANLPPVVRGALIDLSRVLSSDA
jgi:CheY-like chemotaxis protein